jgi:hypothetical protein
MNVPNLVTNHMTMVCDKCKIMASTRIEPKTSGQSLDMISTSNLPTVPSVLVHTNKLYAIYTLPLSKYNMF